jgi:hypothetical protein
LILTSEVLQKTHVWFVVKNNAEVEKKHFLLLIAKSWGHKAVTDVKKCQKFTVF